MAERGDFGEELRGHLLRCKPREERRAFGVDERLDRLEAGGQPRRHEVLPLADEEPQPLPLSPRPQSPDELQSRVRGGGDHESRLPSAVAVAGEAIIREVDLTLLSYNICEGGRGRLDRLAHVIAAARPDVAALLEATPESAEA